MKLVNVLKMRFAKILRINLMHNQVADLRG